MTEERSKETVGAEDARLALAANEATAIDLRDDEAWREGHLPAARHIAEDELSEADDLPDQRLIVVCEDGERSAGVAETLRDDGHDAVALEGGMKAWKSEDMPMQPSHDPDEDSPI